jgi:hypothetical protein
MQESSTLEGVSEVTDLGVCWYETSEPIVCDADCWDLLSLAAILKTGLAKHCNLLDFVCWLGIRIRTWKDISIVEEYNFHTTHLSLMDAKGEPSSDTYVHVVDVVNASRILLQISSLSFPVSLVIW